MAGNAQISTLLRGAFLSTALLALFNSGKVEIRSGTQPADANTTATGTVLATLTLNSTAFAAQSGGSATANTIASVTAAATGTATWARIYESDGTTVLMDVNVATSGADLNLNSTSIVSGGTVSVTSFVLSVLAQGV